MDERDTKLPMSLHILPFSGALICFFLAWGLGGYFIRMLPIDDLYKGIMIAALSITVFYIGYKALNERAFKKYLSRKKQ